MEADTSRLESALAGAESRIFNLEREVNTLRDLFAGKTRQNVVFPSGAAGFNQIFEVIAAPLAIVEAESSTNEHQWRTYQSSSTEFTVMAGNVEGYSSITAESLVFTATGEGKVWCEITLEPLMHTPDSAVINYGSTMPTDTAYIQYWLIAEIFNSTPDEEEASLEVRQIQFEPIRTGPNVNLKLENWVTETGGQIMPDSGGLEYFLIFRNGMLVATDTEAPTSSPDGTIEKTVITIDATS